MTDPSGAPQFARASSTGGAGGEVVAVVEEAASARRCLTAAHRAAQRAGLPLTALHICADPARLITAPEETALQRMRESEEGTALERLTQVRLVFRSWAAFTGAHANWLEHVGTVAESLSEEAKVAALIAIAQPHNLDSVDALHAAIFRTGRPVLYVPTEGALPTTFGEHVVIAWKSRPQARRAVASALPWLQSAKRVTIVIIDAPERAGGSQDVVRLLEGRDVAVETRTVRTDRRHRVAARLLSEADAVAADAIVMGAYRFGQVFEWVFGGVTREVFNQTRLPVFLIH